MSENRVAICRLLGIVAVAWSVGAVATAAPVSCFQVQHLQQLIALGQDGCQVGTSGRHVFDVSYTTVVSGGAIDVGADAVSVDVASTRYGQGLSFTGNWAAAPGQTLDGVIAYRFSQIRAHGAGVGFQAMVPTASGAVSMRGTLCRGDADPCPPGALLHLPAFVGVSLPSGVSSGHVQLSFSIEGPAPPETAVTLVRVDSRLEVPEPCVLTLAICGFIAYRSRRRVD